MHVGRLALHVHVALKVEMAHTLPYIICNTLQKAKELGSEWSFPRWMPDLLTNFNPKVQESWPNLTSHKTIINYVAIHSRLKSWSRGELSLLTKKQFLIALILIIVCSHCSVKVEAGHLPIYTVHPMTQDCNSSVALNCKMFNRQDASLHLIFKQHLSVIIPTILVRVLITLPSLLHKV